MENKDFLNILKNIYGTLTYNDWIHAREYVKLQIELLKKECEKEQKQKE